MATATERDVVGKAHMESEQNSGGNVVDEKTVRITATQSWKCSDRNRIRIRDSQMSLSFSFLFFKVSFFGHMDYEGFLWTKPKFCFLKNFFLKFFSKVDFIFCFQLLISQIAKKKFRTQKKIDEGQNNFII